MIIFDFLIYNLTNWYTARRSGLRWNTPLEKAIYVTAIITMLWLLDFYLIINTGVLKNISLTGPPILFVVLGLCIMQIFGYIYKKKGRFERLNEAPNKPLNASDKVGQAFSIGCLFLPMLIFGILLITI